MKAVPLRAGPVTMMFDAPNAFLRHLHAGDREIVRGVYGTVRDRNWGRVIPKVENLLVEAGEGGFCVSFNAACRTGDIDFVWRGEISGTNEGTVRFVFDGKANSTFLRNRIGLCVLHPGDACAGVPCSIEHVDGTVTESHFPELISPHQPIRNIHVITHEVTPRLRAEVRLSGETFEMEDQRNWTDASYKTYCTPLEVPFPVEIKAGERVRQEVVISLHGDAPDIRTSSRSQPVISVNWDNLRPRPLVGLCLATGDEADTPGVMHALRRLRPDHLRVDLALGKSDWHATWDRARAVARAVETSLHVALSLDDDAANELETLLATARKCPAPVSLWLVFHRDEKSTSARWIQLAADKLSTLDAGIPIASGTNAFFTELNRERFVAEADALPCYSLNPQVHAYDELSIVETLGAQRATLETTRAFCPRPIVVSPVTLRMRFNPNATEVQENPVPDTDPRQATVFAAAWTVGSLARLGAAGLVHSLTYYETAGPRGVMDAGGSAFPVFHVLAAAMESDRIADTRSTHPLKTEALALADNLGKRRWLVAGFSAPPQSVILRDVCSPLTISKLTADGFMAAGGLKPDADGRVALGMDGLGVWLLEEES